MNNLGQTPDPEYLQQECTRLLQEVKSRLRSRKFQDDLRVFLRILERDFSNFLNPQSELLTRVKLKLNGEKGFVENLQNFLDRERNENVSQELEETRKETRKETVKTLQAKPQIKVEKKAAPSPAPELLRERELVNRLLDEGYPFSGSGYYQIETSLKNALKPKSRIQPHQIIEHLYKNLKNKKRSRQYKESIESSAKKLGIIFERLTSENHQDPLNPTFVLTADGYCLLIDPDTCRIQFDPVRLYL
jgi:hypothetical protein